MKLNSILRGETVVVLFLLFILQSCSAPNADKEAPAVNEFKSGQKFKIVLPENHDEGYLWKLKSDPNKSLIDNMGPVWHGNEKGIYFRFVALSAGTDTLRFTQYKTDAVTKERDSVKSAVYIIKIAD
jgi:predicted secreted protein